MKNPALDPFASRPFDASRRRPRPDATRLLAGACLAAIATLGAAASAPRPEAAPPTGAPAARANDAQTRARTDAPADSAREKTIYEEPIPAAATSLRFVRVPAGDGEDDAPFWISATEVPWDAYDVFVYALDDPSSANSAESAGGGEDGNGGNGGSGGSGGDDRGDPDDGGSTEEPDAITRPSKPYIPPDRGFGHAGYPAISMSFGAAEAFCVWLSKSTGRKYRLPTEAEWERACRAGADTPWAHGDDAEQLAAYAWYWDNADDKTHPVAAKKPNALGIHDMHGNAMEWCVGADGKPVAKGGSFRDDPLDLAWNARRLPNDAWNASDPQIPKSRWWLADAPFIGFRIVRAAADDDDAAPDATGDAKRPPTDDENGTRR